MSHQNREPEKTTRRVEWAGSDYSPKVWADVVLTEFYDRGGYQQPRPKKIGQYDFVFVDDYDPDEVRGEPPETDGRAVFYVGTGAKHYYTSKARDGVPVDVYEGLREKGYALVEKVDGGWVRWEGRPEWSDRYVDYTDAEVVDLDEIIAERRGDDDE